jgi:hypothetical protein
MLEEVLAVEHEHADETVELPGALDPAEKAD